jgi:REP element-mobilizing transposase RayT
MTNNLSQQRRRPTRLKSYDYSRAGAYFVTVCTYNRECILGNITNGEMRLSKYGKIVKVVWHELPSHYQHVCLDEFVIMPNHIHGIIILQDAVGEGLKPSPTIRRHALTEIIRGLKTFSARDINSSRNTPKKHVWQRSYHEHVIRSETDLQSIREYIANNPLQWDIDSENPEKIGYSR